MGPKNRNVMHTWECVLNRCLGLVNHCLSFALYLCALVHQIASCLMLQVAHCAAKSIISRALRPMDTGSTSMLWEGARVRVHSLVGAPRYNGLQGKAGAFTASTGRWSVHIEPDGQVLAVKYANLALLCSRADCSVSESPLLRCARCKMVAYCSKGVWRKV